MKVCRLGFSQGLQHPAPNFFRLLLEVVEPFAAHEDRAEGSRSQEVRRSANHLQSKLGTYRSFHIKTCSGGSGLFYGY